MANHNIRLKIESTAVVRGQVRVPGDEVTVDAKTADQLVERNLATVVGEETPEGQMTGGENGQDADDELTGMTVDELKEYANEAGVDLTGKTERDDILAAIREAM